MTDDCRRALACQLRATAETTRGAGYLTAGRGLPPRINLSSSEAGLRYCENPQQCPRLLHG